MTPQPPVEKLIERLRDDPIPEDCYEAADEIERLCEGAEEFKKLSRECADGLHDTIDRLSASLEAAEAQLSTVREQALEEAAKVAEAHGEPYAVNTNTGAMMFRAVTNKIAQAIRELSLSSPSKEKE